ncbi:hypothetical protein Forpe1208_v017144 [Fusarium oxysporum f. sp. rapae]|uniref:Uncharacterized protein n=1 Tax=Fusarium oxysporum f. sp. rapae TaxID=485398 RepID=A0A8J5TNT2_FUSOX|nr:hypothetical protein Forpe1208_v017144 [Fusarium oxysporum f. sp. rapae]
MRRSTKKEKEQWSPWTLTQLSRDYNKFWQHSYTYLTKHLICPFQLKDYMATCFNDRKDDNVVDKRLRPPVNPIDVRLTAENLIRVSLYELYEAGATFSRYKAELGANVRLGGCGEQKVSKEETKRRHSVFKRLDTLIFNGPLRELLPGTKGTGKIGSIFMDQYTNIWLHPTPEYLSSNPALDPGLREALYELWTSAAVKSLNLLFLPLRESDGEGILPLDYEPRCQLSGPFWNQHPHKSHILSVKSIERYKHKHRIVSAFVVKPKGYVLPEGYSLKEIGINEEKIHAAGGAAVYLQLVGAEDQKFDIQLEG